MGGGDYKEEQSFVLVFLSIDKLKGGRVVGGNPDTNKKAGQVDLPFQISLVAGVGFEPTTFGLWARRATTAPPRDNDTPGPPIFRETDRFCVQPDSGQGLGH